MNLKLINIIGDKFTNSVDFFPIWSVVSREEYGLITFFLNFLIHCVDFRDDIKMLVLNASYAKNSFIKSKEQQTLKGVSIEN